MGGRLLLEVGLEQEALSSAACDQKEPRGVLLVLAEHFDEEIDRLGLSEVAAIDEDSLVGGQAVLGAEGLRVLPGEVARDNCVGVDLDPRRVEPRLVLEQIVPVGRGHTANPVRG